MLRAIRFAPLAAIPAVLIPVTALAAGASVQPLSGSLLARGAAVDVSVSITCPAGYVTGGQFAFGGVVATVQEAVTKTDQALGSGFGGSGIVCTGSPQTADVVTAADPSGAAFRNGPALVSASMFACDPTNPSNCVSAFSGPTVIRLTK